MSYYDIYQTSIVLRETVKWEFNLEVILHEKYFMINYNITSKIIGSDPYGIEKHTYQALEGRLKSLVENVLAEFEGELIGYILNVDMDMNREKVIQITSPTLPDDLRQRIHLALSELGK